MKLALSSLISEIDKYVSLVIGTPLVDLMARSGAAVERTVRAYTPEGAVVVILLLSAIVLRILYDSTRTNDLFSRLVCVGIGGMLMVQMLINIGMCAGIMPVIGLTLPFFSYGGSSILTLFLAMGIVSGIRSRTLPEWLRKT